MKKWDVAKFKWSIEVKTDGMILKYDHDSDHDAPLELQYMTKCEDPSIPSSSIYPPVLIRIDQDLTAIERAKKQTINGTVDIIHRRDYQSVDRLAEGWKFVSTLAKKYRQFHVTEISYVGILKPGTNYIYIYPLQADDVKNTSPFRLTATIMCEACGRLGWNKDIW